jgi:hypothetical protein
VSTDVLNAVPVEACRLAGGAVKFAAADRVTGNTPIKMLARSAGPIDHWYWGRIVHDMAGMKLHKTPLTCDYEHYDPIGFLDVFDADNDGLEVSGELVATDVAGDVTTRILQLSRGGVPFEASIYFDEDELLLEYVPEGYQAQVNGATFEGPGVIAREWWLRGVAVCSYGYDKNTQSTFAREAGKQTFQLTHQKEATMPKTITTQLSGDAKVEADPKAKLEANDPASQPAVEPAADPATAPATSTETAPAATADQAAPTPAADALSAVRSELKRFRTAFGDKGPVYFDDGLSFEEASARHVKELSEFGKKMAEENAELKKKLSAATGQPLGELTPVGFESSEENKKGGFAGKIRFAGEPRT